MPLLTKSDFKIASSCAKKLVYKKKRFPTTNDENEYMEMLAQGGFIIGKMAQLLYPEGHEVPADKGIEFSVAATRELLDSKTDVVIFEAAFLAGNKFIRADILEKKGNFLKLIEVKAKSHDSEDEKSKVQKRLEEYIRDLAFQDMVLREALAGQEYKIYSSLLMPDKSKRTKIEGLAGWFRVREGNSTIHADDLLPARSSAGFSTPTVGLVYKDETERTTRLKQLQEDPILSEFPMDKEIEKIRDHIKTDADRFFRIITNGIEESDYAINKTCKACEFNTGKGINNNGYAICWGDNAYTDPHIFDLYYGGAIGHHKKGWYFDELIEKGTVGFDDIDPERLKDSKGNMGSRGSRQLIQIEHTKSNTEYIGPGLKKALELKYPLHFIDFETYTGAVPFHQHMRPYETIAFQWSCHTITDEQSGINLTITHKEWINREYSFPNFRFAEALREHIGDDGTPLMWATHENTVLSGILEQMEIFNYENDDLKSWLDKITSDTKKEKKGRLVDMNAITANHYFHPYMKGRTSIKKVLPAVWNHNAYLHDIEAFKKYYKSDESGIFFNPYDTLPPIAMAGNEDEVIKEGTAAMRAYHEIMFGNVAQDTPEREKLISLLLQYCQLDTMAMVIIWKYWKDRCP